MEMPFIDIAQNAMAKTFGSLPAMKAVSAPVETGSLIGRTRSIAGKFFRDRRGATALEFAIVFIPFLMFVLMIFQIALYHFGLQTLDHAVRLAARQVMLGEVESASRTKEAFKRNLVCANLIVTFECNDVGIAATKVAASTDQGPGSSLSQFVDLGGLSLQPQASGSFCIGGPGDYIFLDVSYAFPNFVGSIFAGTGLTSSTFALRSTSFFRNEPYKGAGAGC